MNSTELQSQVEDLKLMLLEPKLFVKNYFGDLINQFDIQITKFEIEKNKQIKEIKNWREPVVEQFQKTESEILANITSEFKLDYNLTVQAENFIKVIEEKLGNKQYSLSLEDFKELENKVYEHSLEIKLSIMGNQCFMVLNDEQASDIADNNIESPDLWGKVFPVIQIKGGFIDKKGIKILE